MENKTSGPGVWEHASGEMIDTRSMDYPRWTGWGTEVELYARINPKRAKSDGTFTPYRGDTDWHKAANRQLEYLAQYKQSKARQK